MKKLNVIITSAVCASLMAVSASAASNECVSVFDRIERINAVVNGVNISNCSAQSVFQSIAETVVKLTDQREYIPGDQQSVDQNDDADDRQHQSQCGILPGIKNSICAAGANQKQEQKSGRGALPEIGPESPDVGGCNFAFPVSIQPENHVIQGSQRSADGKNRDTGA